MGVKTLTRGAGILLSISSLPSSYGIGTFGNAAFRFVDLLADLKQKYWQVLPMGPTSVGDSPFQLLSAFAGNPYFIDLDDFMAEGLLQQEEIAAYNWGNDATNVDYSILYENRFSVLKLAFERFDQENAAYKEFCELENNWLDDYSLFMALKEFFGNKAWNMWDKPLRDREETALQEYREILKEQMTFWKFCQYEFFRQWNALKKYANRKGVQMIGDMPFYIAYDSADVWAHRDNFQLDIDGAMHHVAAVPPDALSAKGQVWGEPLYDWKHMEEDGFFWWQSRMEQYAAMYDVIKLDHFNGIVKYFSMPIEKDDIRYGKWVKGPGKKLADILAKAAGDKQIIAEDIGVVIPSVKKMEQKYDWYGMKVMLFAFDGDAGNEHLPHNYTDTQLVVYAGTHDNDTIIGYYRDKTEYELAYMYSYLDVNKKEDISDAVIREAYSSIADVVILQMQDILQLGNEARMNQPSTIGMNWKWRILNDLLTEERRNWIRTLTALYKR